MSLLEIQNLEVSYETDEGKLTAVNDVSFSLEPNEKFGLVGESGCGKSTIAKSIIRILPDNGHISGGCITYNPLNLDIASASKRELQKLRWEHIAMIPQSAMNALDPVYTVGEQIVEAQMLHRDMKRKKARSRASELLTMVGLDRERIDSYPHQLSGGMRQRAMIAMALVLEPSLVIADEPTTALDVITQDHIIDEIDKMSERTESTLLMISHDISVIAETCDRMGVMYGGKLVEVGDVDEVIRDPKHPYTQGLLKAYPTLSRDDELITMAGQPPDLINPPTGCSFYDRCPYREERCREDIPALADQSGGRQAACFVTEAGVDIDARYDGVFESKEGLWEKL